MRKYLLIAVTLFIASTALAETREIVQEGIAYLGSDITVEDAQNVAINDARQKALNALGTFIESNQKLVNGRLTKKEISSITGAVMKSKVLSETKTTDGNMFVLKLKVRFEIDMNSFNKALQKYQDQSVDKKTIKRLMATIQKMQDEMLKTSKGSFESVEIADEIAYINKRLGKALTTGEKIDRELEIRKKYEKNLTQQIINFTKLYMQRLSSSYEWNDVPYKGEYFTSKLPLNNGSTCNAARTALGMSKNVEVKDVGLGILATIIRYRKNNLRTYPEILPSWSFWRYFHMYINEERYTFLYRARMKAFENLGRGYITIKYSGLLSPDEVSSVGNRSMTYSDHLLIGLNTIESPASCQFGFNNIEIGLPYSVHYTQIKTVNFRWGRFNPNSIEIKFK